METVDLLKNFRGQMDISMSIYVYEVPFKPDGTPNEEERVYVSHEDIQFNDSRDMANLIQDIEKSNKIKQKLRGDAKTIQMKYLQKQGSAAYVAPVRTKKPWWKRIFNF